jgi:hypothetical protein
VFAPWLILCFRSNAPFDELIRAAASISHITADFTSERKREKENKRDGISAAAAWCALKILFRKKMMVCLLYV